MYIHTGRIIHSDGPHAARSLPTPGIRMMLGRDPGKRRVKIVQNHLLQLDFGLGDSDEESDFDATDDDDENLETGNTDESAGGSEEEKPYYFGMDVDDSVDDEDYVPKKKRKKQQKPKHVEKMRIKSLELSQTLQVDSSEVISKARPKKVLICRVCLGYISETDDEILECDYCGVAAQEGCYGISDNQSAASTEFSASTELWFCDACKAGVRPT